MVTTPWDYANMLRIERAFAEGIAPPRIPTRFEVALPAFIFKGHEKELEMIGWFNVDAYVYFGAIKTAINIMKEHHSLELNDKFKTIIEG